MARSKDSTIYLLHVCVGWGGGGVVRASFQRLLAFHFILYNQVTLNSSSVCMYNQTMNFFHGCSAFVNVCVCVCVCVCVYVCV